MAVQHLLVELPSKVVQTACPLVAPMAIVVILPALSGFNLAPGSASAVYSITDIDLHNIEAYNTLIR